MNSRFTTQIEAADGRADGRLSDERVIQRSMSHRSGDRAGLIGGRVIQSTEKGEGSLSFRSTPMHKKKMDAISNTPTNYRKTNCDKYHVAPNSQSGKGAGSHLFVSGCILGGWFTKEY